jgi:hypothetical protein
MIGFVGFFADKTAPLVICQRGRLTIVLYFLGGKSSKKIYAYFGANGSQGLSM